MARKVSLDDKSPELLNTLADIFDDLQTTLEPIRDKALDERSRLIGYAQCAEQMIKIIADHVVKLKGMAKTKQEAVEKAEAEKTEMELAVEKPVRKPRVKAAKETTEGGDNRA